MFRLTPACWRASALLKCCVLQSFRKEPGITKHLFPVRRASVVWGPVWIGTKLVPVTQLDAAEGWFLTAGPNKHPTELVYKVYKDTDTMRESLIMCVSSIINMQMCSVGNMSPELCFYLFNCQCVVCFWPHNTITHQ